MLLELYSNFNHIRVRGFVLSGAPRGTHPRSRIAIGFASQLPLQI